MADFKIQGITPIAGKIKVGDNSVEKIYSGSTLVWPTSSPDPGPGQVQICNLIWTDTNSSETELIAGGNIPILTNNADWGIAYQNQTPAACYWDFDPNNASYGLLYSYFTKDLVKPPAGFRLPTTSDWDSITKPPCYTNTGSRFNRYGANPGNWDPAILTNTAELGDSGLNIQGYGDAIYKTSTIELDFINHQIAGAFWINNTATFPAAYGFYLQANPGDLGSISYGDLDRRTFFMRFVKDA